MNRDKMQTLRGLACLLLVVYHVVGATPTQGMQIAHGWLRQSVDTLTMVRMPVFALLAGALHGAGCAAGWALIGHKAWRLLVPMLCVGTIFAFVQRSTVGATASGIDFSLLHIVPVAHYWFLESLFWVFVLVGLGERWWPMRGWRSWLVYFLGSAVLYLVAPPIIWFGVLGAVYLLPYFLLGMACTRLGWDADQRRVTMGLVVTLCGLGLAVVLAVTPSSSRFTVEVLVASALTSVGLWSVGLRWKPLAWIGKYSLSIFLFHVFFSAAVRRTLYGFAVTDPVLHLLVGCVAAVFGSVLLQQWLERSPWAMALVLGGTIPQPMRRVTP